ncbi:MAG: response regulator [Burkholderiaceae bacterium]
MADPIRLLIVDDDLEIRDALVSHLNGVGFQAQAVGNAAQARSWLARQSADLVVLDVMMPGEDGLSLCRHLSETAAIPVILLTALTDETDRIVGLEIGADDYLPKPFSPRELVARIRAVLRRSGVARPRDASPQALSFAGWTLDPEQGELKGDDGVIVSLSRGELELLRAFLDHAGEVLSRDQLMTLTRGREAMPFERSIDNTIARLRRKVETDPKNPRIIKTVWGGGYRLIVDPSRS